MQAPPVKSFEWAITDRCNYSCSYCNQNNYRRFGHCSDSTISAVFKLIEGFEESWLIKIIGGEAFLHPRFFEICGFIAAKGHRICITTNFSASKDDLCRFIDVCGDKLSFLAASYQMDQLESHDEFIEKAILFNEKKHPAARLGILAVMKEESFTRLRDIEKQFTQLGIDFQYQVLIEDGIRFHRYPQDIDGYLKDKSSRNTEIIRSSNYFGTLCNAGKDFFVIDVNGDVTRCFSFLQPLFYLGNITKGGFRQLSKPMPCLAARCTCTGPANRNMICYGKKAGWMEMIITAAAGTISYAGYLPNLLSKIFRTLTNRYKRQ